MARRRLQFGLQFLFAAITVLAVSLWGVRKAVELSTSIPLAIAMDSFNTRIESDSTQSLGPKLTEDEVLRAVKSQAGRLGGQPDGKATCEHIIRTKRLPNGATFSVTKSQVQTPMGPDWIRFVSLNVTTKQGRDCSLTIRQVNAP